MIRRKPFPFQETDVQYIESKKGRVLNANDTGLGKTSETLWYYERNPNIGRMIVLCPVSVKYNWEREVKEVLGFRPTVLEGMTPERPGMVPPAKIVVLNYTILPAWLKYLQSYAYSCVVIDECQNICNSKTAAARAVSALCQGIKHVLPLSATPLTNRPADLFPVLHILWPHEFPSPIDFGYTYCNPRMVRGKIEFKGADKKTLPELHARLKKLGMIRHRKVDVLKDLPEKIRRVVPIPLYDPKGEYKFATEHFMDWLRGKSATRAARIGNTANMQALAKVGYLLRLAARKKLKNVMSWLDNQLESTDEKVISVCVHTKMIEALQRRYGSSCLVVDGSVTGRKRQMAFDIFKNNPKKRMLIGQFKAMGTGSNLQFASIINILEIWWAPGTHEQIEGRIDRIGQKTKPLISYLFGIGTIEEKVYKLVEKKRKDISAILDGRPCEGDLNVYSLLMDLLDKEAA